MAKQRFPDQVLCQMFDCLFRAVIGMAYPDAFQPVGPDPKTQSFPTVSESCTKFPPLTSHCQRETNVHVDIDPLNVLVGEFYENERNMIADLGLATVFDGGYRSTTEKWDYVNSTPQAARYRTAGNYNWWTYGGYVMHERFTET
ncbi:hypothetical protein N657DRAFT_682481 [Parathielavia appendiculata]|uniref:Protein kinase domain-containing protein n=1 Tax=Parathielavia appendiculata TaxID=2587402 RepID=A0AAN6TWN3_9PEZI|nr:hypothetical protein N657DRAFT_682481 [Parathielavia appendiculata]